MPIVDPRRQVTCACSTGPCRIEWVRSFLMARRDDSRPALTGHEGESRQNSGVFVRYGYLSEVSHGHRCCYAPDDRSQPHKHVLATLGRQERLGELLRRHADALRWGRAGETLSLTDGGLWNRNQLRKRHPKLKAMLLDVCRPSEHVWDTARVSWGEGEAGHRSRTHRGQVSETLTAAQAPRHDLGCEPGRSPDEPRGPPGERAMGAVLENSNNGLIPECVADPPGGGNPKRR